MMKSWHKRAGRRRKEKGEDDMKVLLVNGSGHTDGTTMAVLDEMTGVFGSEGVETEIIQTGNGPIADCMQCHGCDRLGKCVLDDDGINEFVEKAYDADGFVFATPVYYAHPSGRLFSFLDRAFYSNSAGDGGGRFQVQGGCFRGGGKARRSVRHLRRGKQVLRHIADAGGRIHVLEFGARSGGGRCSPGRRGYADRQEPCAQYGVDDALL